MKTGAQLIADERQRQIDKEGWSAEHDDHHAGGILAKAGGCYAENAVDNIERIELGLKTDGDYVPGFPFSHSWWKPTPDEPIRQLAKAGALIAAEIDRLQRS